MAKRVFKGPQTQFPTIALRDLCLFPGCRITFVVGRPQSLAALKAIGRHKRIALLTQRDAGEEQPTTLGDFMPAGVLADVTSQTSARETDNISIAVMGVSRVAPIKVVKTEPSLVVEYGWIEDQESDAIVDDGEIQAIEELANFASPNTSAASRMLSRMRRSSFGEGSTPAVLQLSRALGFEIIGASQERSNARSRIYDVMQSLAAPPVEKIQVLAEARLTKQVTLTRELVTAAAAKASWRIDLNEQVTKAISEEHRRLFLRELVRTSLDELGESGLVVQGSVFRGRGFKLKPGLGFVLMPFDERFKPVFSEIVKPIAAQFGIGCVRADDLYGPSPIIEDIWRSINEARVIVSDVTSRNPNVFYETGLAHAIGKDVIIITQSMDDVPFDLRHIRCVVYRDSVAGFRRLERDLDEMFAALGLTRLPERPS